MLGVELSGCIEPHGLEDGGVTAGLAGGRAPRGALGAVGARWGLLCVCEVE